METTINSTVWIKSVPRESAQKRDEYVLYNGRKMNKTKAKQAMTVLCFPYSLGGGRLVTGMEQKMTNPWFATEEKNKPELPSNWMNSNIWKQKEITVQDYLEIKHNRQANFYTNKAKNFFESEKGEKMAYLQDFTFSFKDGTTVLDLSNPRDEIAYYLCMASNIVANTKADINPTKHQLYIAQVNEDEMAKARKAEVIEEAVAKLYLLKTKMSATILYKFASILELVKGEVNEDMVRVKLSGYISDESKNQTANIKEFTSLYDLLTAANGKPEFETRYLLRELLNAKIVTNDQARYQWHNAPSSDLQIIGRSYANTIEWLLDPHTKDYRKELCGQLQAKTGLKLQ